MCLAIGIAASAQTPDVEETVVYDENPHRVITNTFWNNWFVSVGGGAQLYFGDSDRSGVDGRIAPSFDVAVGKWFTPVVGARLGYNGFSAKSNPNAENFPVHHLHFDFMLNLNTLFTGYKEDRIWNIIPYAGIGAAFSDGENEPVINGGILNTFSVSDRIDVNLDIRGMLVNDVFDREIGGLNWEGMLSAQVGIACKLGKTGWDRPKTVTRTDRTEANALLKKLNAANSENENLKKSLADAEARAAAVPKEIIKNVAADDIILFNIGESKLTKSAKVCLSGFAAMIKDLDPNNVYVLNGYADEGTGTSKRNQKLSEARVKAAYDYLVEKCGVNADQLETKAHGGVANMYFNDPTLSRAVVIEMK